MCLIDKTRHEIEEARGTLVRALVRIEARDLAGARELLTWAILHVDYAGKLVAAEERAVRAEKKEVA
jgi:hypothetical protein